MVFFLIRDEDAKALRISAFLKLAIFFRDSVKNYSMPTSDILKTCDKSLLERCGYDMSSEVTIKRLEDECVMFDCDAEQAFKRLLHDFGSGYRQAEIEKCECCIEILRKREKDILMQIPKQKKLITCIGISAMALLIILLL